MADQSETFMGEADASDQSQPPNRPSPLPPRSGIAAEWRREFQWQVLNNLSGDQYLKGR